MKGTAQWRDHKSSTRRQPQVQTFRTVKLFVGDHAKIAKQQSSSKRIETNDSKRGRCQQQQAARHHRQT